MACCVGDHAQHRGLMGDGGRACTQGQAWVPACPTPSPLPRPPLCSGKQDSRPHGPTTCWLPGDYCGCPIQPVPGAGQPLNPRCWKSHKTLADRWLAGGPVTGRASVKLPTGTVRLRRPSAPGQPCPGLPGGPQDAGGLVPASPNPLIASGKQEKGQEKQTVHHSGSCVLTGKGDRSAPVASSILGALLFAGSGSLCHRGSIQTRDGVIPQTTLNRAESPKRRGCRVDGLTTPHET